MKILLIEDQVDKKQQIMKFLNDYYNDNPDIVCYESLRGSLRAILIDSSYDYILLDMTMPYFDPDPDAPSDSSPESFAGQEFLEHLHLRKIKCPVIVITQYSFFEGGVTLEKLASNFKANFSENYIGTIYFDSYNDAWKADLSKLLGDL